MKKIFSLMICALAVCGWMKAQTLNIEVGQVTYLFPAEQAGDRKSTRLNSSHVT